MQRLKQRPLRRKCSGSTSDGPTTLHLMKQYMVSNQIFLRYVYGDVSPIALSLIEIVRLEHHRLQQRLFISVAILADVDGVKYLGA